MEKAKNMTYHIIMRLQLMMVLTGSLTGVSVMASAMGVTEEAKPADPYFQQFHPEKAPAPMKHYLHPGDRLAICGDSITEQRKYSRIMETYLTVCVPELNIAVRQYGWSGEKAPQFLARMTNDCLRFSPTIATTCYGMNDHEYRAYEDRIGNTYHSNELAIDESFKAHNVRVIEGAAGCVGRKPSWKPDTNSTLDDLNINLCMLRNIGLDLAKQEKLGFADVFWPMLVQGHQMREKYGTNFCVSGKDGVHPDWAGHVIMAYAFLHEFGLDGEIGTFTVDMTSSRAKVSSGHELVSAKDGEWVIKSHRYPFCIGEGDPAKDDNIRSGTMLVPFNQDLNRLMLVVKHAKGKSYKVTWGDESNIFTGEQLTKGINLAAEFGRNPFSDAFNKVDEAVAQKQMFETKEIKTTFRSKDAKADMEGTVAKAEADRAPLVTAVKEAFVPVTHTIRIVEE